MTCIKSSKQMASGKVHPEGTLKFLLSSPTSSQSSLAWIQDLQKSELHFLYSSIWKQKLLDQEWEDIWQFIPCFQSFTFFVHPPAKFICLWKFNWIVLCRQTLPPYLEWKCIAASTLHNFPESRSMRQTEFLESQLWYRHPYSSSCKPVLI